MALSVDDQAAGAKSRLVHISLLNLNLRFMENWRSAQVHSGGASLDHELLMILMAVIVISSEGSFGLIWTRIANVYPAAARIESWEGEFQLYRCRHRDQLRDGRRRVNNLEKGDGFDGTRTASERFRV